ncbi:MAG TPA: hypothetical protein VJ835_07805 [Fimbriimonadaceae bacterium]|nr:hypothetical protein [Fimbriimonadaceae bacterium]
MKSVLKIFVLAMLAIVFIAGCQPQAEGDPAAPATTTPPATTSTTS